MVHAEEKASYSQQSTVDRPTRENASKIAKKSRRTPKAIMPSVEVSLLFTDHARGANLPHMTTLAIKASTAGMWFEIHRPNCMKWKGITLVKNVSNDGTISGMFSTGLL